ncbi:MAG: hypothetical protein ABSH20_07890 [Tepidisphaeraceae bacterium]|jgi:hypothetical protein
MKAKSLLATVVLGCLVFGSFLPAATPAERPLQRPPVRPDTPAVRPETPVTPPSADLAAWLEKCPALKDHIVWTTGDGKQEKFDAWTAAMKSRIEGFYKKLLDGTANLGMVLPTEDKIDSANGSAYFTSDQAFDVYAAHVAHVIQVEAAKLVPWSIQGLPPAELEHLLASSSYFARIGTCTGGNTYPAGIQPNRDFQEVPEDGGLGEWIGDPRVGYDFLSGKTSTAHTKLIGANELETMANLTAWLRDNVGHGPIDDQVIVRAKNHRFLDARLRPMAGGHLAIAVQGCHSAAKLMVDLARSVNIPLMHARALDNESGDKGGSFFSRTHGGLVYGWAGPRPRVLWHVDDVYARTSHAYFPLEHGTGGLAPPEQATMQYFDELWATPQALAKAGFQYRLQKVLPNKGQGVPSRGNYEDRLDYGMMSGQWKKKGTSDLPSILQLNNDYVLCGEGLLDLAARGSLEAQLAANFQVWKGGFTDAEVPQLRPIKDYADRAAAGLKAIGGGDKFEKIAKDRDAHRGQNLLAAAHPIPVKTIERTRP